MVVFPMHVPGKILTIPLQGWFEHNKLKSYGKIEKMSKSILKFDVFRSVKCGMLRQE